MPYGLEARAAVRALRRAPGGGRARNVRGRVAVRLLALDFHHELYPEAKEILAGRNPFPAQGTDLTRGENYVWPPLAALLVSPLTILPPTAADIAIGLLGLACVGLALWLVGVRDWRVYGVAALWPQVIGEIRISHLTPVLCLLAAIVWRHRDATLRPGLALGVAGAVKFFLWPLGLWLLALRRTGAALVAAAVAAGSLLLVLPFTGLDEFARLMVDLGRAFDQDGYSPFGLLVRLGVSDAVARGVTFALGAFLLVLTLRRRNFALAIAASLVLAPIVWLDYTRSPPCRSPWRDRGCRRSGSCPWRRGASRAPASPRTSSGGSAASCSCSASSYGLRRGTSRRDGRRRHRGPGTAALGLAAPLPYGTRCTPAHGGGRCPRALEPQRHAGLGLPPRALSAGQGNARGQ